MYSVVQFIENSKFQVLCVPSNWIQDQQLLWPKAANKTIEKLRSTAMEYHGPTRKIPVIVSSVASDFQQAERAADELSRREVSDVEGKKKKLKPARKSKVLLPKDYNEIVNVFQKLPAATISTNFDIDNTETELCQQQQRSSPMAKITDCSQRPVSYENSKIFDRNEQQSIHTVPVTWNLEPDCIIEDVATPDPILQNVMYVNDTAADFEITEGAKNVVVNYAEFKNDVQHFIETTIDKVFKENFVKLAALLELNHKTTDQVSENIDDPIASHHKIESESELYEWNLILDSAQLCNRYAQYFTKIIPPNSYVGKVDNACYFIVDCLFTRKFWNNFTWTGINRGQKSGRGFREFGNVISLLLKLVRIGDPGYTTQKLDNFCRGKLFRYSKDRCKHKQLRKSTCRSGRKALKGELMDGPSSCMKRSNLAANTDTGNKSQFISTKKAKLNDNMPGDKQYFMQTKEVPIIKMNEKSNKIESDEDTGLEEEEEGAYEEAEEDSSSD